MPDRKDYFDFGYDHSKLGIQGLRAFLNEHEQPWDAEDSLAELVLRAEQFVILYREENHCSPKDYLDVNFDPGTYTIPKLRQVLTQHGIPYGNKPRLADVIQIFEDCRSAIQGHQNLHDNATASELSRVMEGVQLGAQSALNTNRPRTSTPRSKLPFERSTPSPVLKAGTSRQSSPATPSPPSKFPVRVGTPTPAPRFGVTSQPRGGLSGGPSIGTRSRVVFQTKDGDNAGNSSSNNNGSHFINRASARAAALFDDGEAGEAAQLLVDTAELIVKMGE